MELACCRALIASGRPHEARTRAPTAGTRACGSQGAAVAPGPGVSANAERQLGRYVEAAAIAGAALGLLPSPLPDPLPAEAGGTDHRIRALRAPDCGDHEPSQCRLHLYGPNAVRYRAVSARAVRVGPAIKATGARDGCPPRGPASGEALVSAAHADPIRPDPIRLPCVSNLRSRDSRYRCPYPHQCQILPRIAWSTSEAERGSVRRRTHADGACDRRHRTRPLP